MKKLLGVALAASICLNVILLLRPAAPPTTPARATPPTHPQTEPSASNPTTPPPSPAPEPVPPKPPQVVPSEPAEPAVVILTASPGYVPSRGEITVTWTLVSGKRASADWIGLFETGSENPNELAWKWMTADTGSMTFTAPLKAGSYVCRYSPKRRQSPTASSNLITVVEAPSPPAVSIRGERSYVRVGESISIHWSVLTGRGISTDWLGLYAEGSDNQKYQVWSYVSDGPSGTVTLKAPQTPGVYEVRYLLDNGYEAAASARVVVTP